MDIMTQLAEKHQLQMEDLMYVGDDMPDYEVMQVVGIAVCPSDAVDDIKTISHYMSPKKGGEGVVRDVLEKILKLKGRWGVQTEIKSV